MKHYFLVLQLCNPLEVTFYYNNCHSIVEHLRQSYHHAVPLE